MLSVLKILSLAAGAHIDSVFRFSNVGSREEERVPYPGLAYLFWILFISFATILFLNFLVSSSVIISTAILMFCVGLSVYACIQSYI